MSKEHRVTRQLEDYIAFKQVWESAGIYKRSAPTMTRHAESSAKTKWQKNSQPIIKKFLIFEAIQHNQQNQSPSYPSQLHAPTQNFHTPEFGSAL